MAMSREEYIKKMGGDNVSFHLMDKATVERRMREGELYAHKKTLDKQKDMRWNTKALNSKVLAGIINGDPVDKIAKSLIDVIGNDKAATMRNARTMLTQAECGGRQDSYENLAAQGVVQKKVWIATPDDRTRESHLEIDGEEVDIDADFSNGCKYPGDPEGDASEVYNCFTGDTMFATDSEIIRSYKHWYDGNLVKIKSASGVYLTCTPNHPILTDRGWIKANALHNGDNLLVTFIGNKGIARRNPNIKHIFARMDTFHKFFYKFLGKRTCGLSVNFHGDIATSDVEIITQKRLLRNDINSDRSKRINKFLLKLADSFAFGFCHFCESFFGIFVSSFGYMCGRSKPFSFFWRGLRHSEIHSIRTIPRGDSVLVKIANDNRSANSELFCESLDRLTGVVFIDKIIDIDIDSFHGFVYNLQTDDNYYFVNNILSNNDIKYNGIFAICHNCRCSMRTHIVGFRRADGSISKVNYGRDETTHDAQIQAEKEERQGGQNGKGKS